MAIGLEGKATAEHGVEDDAAGPEVGFQAVVGLEREQLRGGVLPRAAGGFEQLVGGVGVGQAEIHEF